MCGPNPVNLQPGDVVFSFNKHSWISKIFAWFMQSNWSHCFLIVEKTALRTYEVEMANHHVVESVFEEKYLGKDFSLEVWRPTNLDETTLLQIAAVGIAGQNKRFGYLQLFSLAVRRLLSRIGIHIPNFIHWGVTCPQVVLYPYSTVQGTPFTGVPVDQGDTEDLYQLVVNAPFEKVFSQE